MKGFFLLLLLMCGSAVPVPVVYFSGPSGLLVAKIEDGVPPSPTASDGPMSPDLSLSLADSVKRLPLFSLSNPLYNASVPKGVGSVQPGAEGLEPTEPTGWRASRGLGPPKHMAILSNGAFVGVGTQYRKFTENVRYIASMNPPGESGTDATHSLAPPVPWGAEDVETLDADGITSTTLLVTTPNTTTPPPGAPGGSLLALGRADRLITRNGHYSIRVDWSAMLWTDTYLYLSPGLHGDDESAAHNTISRIPIEVPASIGSPPVLSLGSERLTLVDIPTPASYNDHRPFIHQMLEHPLWPNALIVVGQDGTLHSRAMNGGYNSYLNYEVPIGVVVTQIAAPGGNDTTFFLAATSNTLPPYDCTLLTFQANSATPTSSVPLDCGAVQFDGSPALDDRLFLLYTSDGQDTLGFGDEQLDRLVELSVDVDDGSVKGTRELFVGALHRPRSFVVTSIETQVAGQGQGPGQGEGEDEEVLWKNAGDVACRCDVRSIDQPWLGPDARVRLPDGTTGVSVHEDQLTFGSSVLAKAPQGVTVLGTGLLALPTQAVVASACNPRGFGCACNLPQRNTESKAVSMLVDGIDLQRKGLDLDTCRVTFTLADQVFNHSRVATPVPVVLSVNGEDLWSTSLFLLNPLAREAWCEATGCVAESCVAPDVCYCNETTASFASACPTGTTTPTVDISSFLPPAPATPSPTSRSPISHASETADLDGGALAAIIVASIVGPLLLLLCCCALISSIVKASGTAQRAGAAAAVPVGKGGGGADVELAGSTRVSRSGSRTGVTRRSRSASTNRQPRLASSLSLSSSLSPTVDPDIPSYDDLMSGGTEGSGTGLRLEDD
jgi:hypothetical protein